MSLLALLAMVPGLVVAVVIALRKTTGLIDTTIGISVALAVWGALAKAFCEFGFEGYRTEVYGVRTIRARWRGAEVVLVRKTNLLEFGVIYRALRYAMRRPPPHGGASA